MLYNNLNNITFSDALNLQLIKIFDEVDIFGVGVLNVCITNVLIFIFYVQQFILLIVLYSMYKNENIRKIVFIFDHETNYLNEILRTLNMNTVLIKNVSSSTSHK